MYYIQDIIPRKQIYVLKSEKKKQTVNQANKQMKNKHLSSFLPTANCAAMLENTYSIILY